MCIAPKGNLYSTKTRRAAFNKLCIKWRRRQRNLSNCVMRCTFCLWWILHRRHQTYSFVIYTCVLCNVYCIRVYEWCVIHTCTYLCVRVLKNNYEVYIIKCRHWNWNERKWMNFSFVGIEMRATPKKNFLYELCRNSRKKQMNWIFHEFSMNMMCRCVHVFTIQWALVISPIDDSDIHAV